MALCRFPATSTYALLGIETRDVGRDGDYLHTIQRPVSSVVADHDGGTRLAYLSSKGRVEYHLPDITPARRRHRLSARASDSRASSAAIYPYAASRSASTMCG